MEENGKSDISNSTESVQGVWSQWIYGIRTGWICCKLGRKINKTML